MRYIIPLVDGVYTEGDSSITTEGIRNDSATHKIIVALNGAPEDGKLTIQFQRVGSSRWEYVDYTNLSEVDPQKIEFSGSTTKFRFIVEGASGTGTAVISDTELGESITPYGLFGDTNGMTPVEIGNSARFGAGSQPVVHIGIDSLTAGSGGSSYNKHFADYMRGIAGYGGHYVPFFSALQVSPEDYDWLGVQLAAVGVGRQWVDSLSFSDERKVQSVNGLGFYYDGTQTGGNDGFEVYVKFPYRKIRLFYRQQSGGGTFDVDRPTYGESVSVDTNGAESIQYVDIDLYTQGASTNPGTIDNTGWNLRMYNVVGDVQVHGALFYSGEDGPIVINDARAGRTLYDYVATSSQVREDFARYCGVTHTIFNAGTNDIVDGRTASEFSADLDNALSFEGKVSRDILIVFPNYNSSESQEDYRSAYESAAEKYGELYDMPSIYGNYAAFVSKGWMNDATHPNDFFNRYLGMDYAKRIIGRVRNQTKDILS